MTNTILRKFTADFTGELHYAQRADGQWFTRSRFRDPRFGYRTGAWRKTSVEPDGAVQTTQRARLPKD